MKEIRTLWKKTLALLMCTVLAVGMLSQKPLSVSAAENQDTYDITVHFMFYGRDIDKAQAFINQNMVKLQSGEEGEETTYESSREENNIEPFYTNKMVEASYTFTNVTDGNSFENYKVLINESVYEEIPTQVLLDGNNLQIYYWYYAINFYDGDDLLNTEYVIRNQTIPSYVPTKEGYTFLGWTTDKEGQERWDKWEEVIAVNRLYALWIEGDHEHDYGTEWQANGDEHWKICSCGERAEVGVHKEDDGTVTTEATATQAGTRTYQCRTCKRVLREEVIPATGAVVKPDTNPTENPGDNTGKQPTDNSAEEGITEAGTGESDIKTPDTENESEKESLTDKDKQENQETKKHNNQKKESSTDTKTDDGKEEQTEENSKEKAEGTKPVTGDFTPVEMYATLAMIAGFAYLFLYFAGDKHGMTEEEKKALTSRLIQWAKRGGRVRKMLAISAIFLLLLYYHSIGKKVDLEWKQQLG